MNNIFNFLLTENIALCNILTYFVAILELYAYYSIIKTIYSITPSNKSILLYYLIGIITFPTIRLLVPLPYSFVLNFIVMLILISQVFKLSFLRSIIVLCIFLSFTVIVEYIVMIIFTKILLLDIYYCANVPLYRLFSSIFMYTIIFTILYVFKAIKTNISIAKEMPTRSQWKIFINILLGIFIVTPNLIYLILNSHRLPTHYVLYNFICASVLFWLNAYNTHKFNKLDITTRELETAKLYNQTLNSLVDANRAFKHDINNIIQGIGGYIELNDIKGLSEYYKTGLLPEIEKVNNLSVFNPDVINSPPVFGLLLSKHGLAKEKNVQFKITSFFDYTSINMEVFNFNKIFGILLDNAIEAASLCENPLVDLYVSIDFYNRKQIFKISNTYLNKDIDITLIFTKDYSTKKQKSGFGLWEVKQIIKKYPQTSLITSKTNELFTQKLEISF